MVLDRGDFAVIGQQQSLEQGIVGCARTAGCIGKMFVDDQIGLNGRCRVHHVDGGGQGIGANRGSVEGRHPNFDAVGTGVVRGKGVGEGECIGRKRRHRTRIGLAGGWASVHPVI